MRRLVEWIDRLKIVEGAILIGTVMIGYRINGILWTTTVVASVPCADRSVLLVAA